MNETIAAISTPFGKGGIGIIRLSGNNSFEIAERIFKGRKPVVQMKSHTINYGKIMDPVTGEILDEVLLSIMKAPHTFTGEHVAEINCHGGTVVLIKIMDLVLREGACPAQPGEFTRRAFINGRLDLSQAEAVIDIINAKTSESSRAAVDQLEGRLSRKINESRSKLVEVIAHIEATIDYPEHDIEDITGRQVYEEALAVKELLDDILTGFERGRVIREGISVVIAGKPNVGKSSLLNELSGKNKAIVTDVPGTTRDIIEEYIDIKGIPVRILDTAGIRETHDPVEKIGVEKAEKALDDADLIIMMLDASTGVEDEDIRIIERVSGRKIIYVINKTDISQQNMVVELEKRLTSFESGENYGEEKARSNPLKNEGWSILEVSVKNSYGINEIEEIISKRFMSDGIDSNSEVIITNIRHKNLVEMAIKSLKDAATAYESGMPLDFITIDIRNAADYLGQITGESVSEDVVQEIFSRFCVGK